MSRRTQPHTQWSTAKSRSRLAAGLIGAAGMSLAGLTPIGNALAETPSVAAALSLKPVQADVNYELVEPADVAACKIRDIDRDDWSGWEVTGSAGQTLRRFADTNGDKKVDLWCYFRYGVEVYRDQDADFNGKADQYRWLGTEGTRWGLDQDEDGQIDAWKQISAEEVTAELVASIRTAKAARFANLLASERELRDAGLSNTKARELAEKALAAAKRFAELSKAQTAVGQDARWIQFAGSPPGILPAGSDDATGDVIVYENAVAMYESGGTSGQIMVGTMIKSGDSWKLVDLPSLNTPGAAIEQSAGNFFRPATGTNPATNVNAASGEEVQKLVSGLEAIDRQLDAETDAKKVALLHQRRADAVEQLVAAAGTPGDREMWIRQLVDTVSFATQSDSYPGGLERLKQVRTKYASADKDLAAFIEYQLITTEYAVRLKSEKEAVKVQDWYLNQLTSLVDAFPGADESAKAMLQLALGKEFENEEAEALQYYRQIAKDYAGTDEADKATGAIRRLDSIGRVVELSGTTIEGKPFKLSQFKGKPVVIQYWASWCDPCTADAKQLRTLQAQYRKQGLQIVGVNIDGSRADAVAYLKKQNSMPWTQLFEEGGLELSPLAKQFGVQTLPTMMLIDDAGKLVRHNVSAAELPAELEKIIK